jgi:hypothetical protein
MVNAFAAFGFADLCLAFAALELFSFLNSQCGAGTTTPAEAPLLHSAAEVSPPLAAVVVLFVAITLTYRHLSHRHAYAVPVAGAGNGRRSISGSGLVMFVLCVSAGTLEFIVFGGRLPVVVPITARSAWLLSARCLPRRRSRSFSG